MSRPRLSIHRTLLLWAAWLSLGLASPVYGHLMPSGHGTINVVGSKLYVILSVPVAGFSLQGPRGNDRINQAELKQSQRRLHEQIESGLVLRGGDDVATFEKILFNLPVGNHHDAQTNADLTVMIVAQLERPPTSISMHWRLWAGDADALKIKASVSEGARTLRSEVATLSAPHPSFVFFATPGQVFQASLASGTHHILYGLDHLLFVALMLIGPFVRRRWAALMGTFTLAYALTFAASTLNWVHPDPAWIEPVILGSLAVAALPIILRRRPRLRVEAGVVGLLGHFHGFGFASAMGDGQAHTHLPWVKIAGFVSGAFAGQLIIAAALAGLALVVQRTSTKT